MGNNSSAVAANARVPSGREKSSTWPSNTSNVQRLRPVPVKEWNTLSFLLLVARAKLNCQMALAIAENAKNTAKDLPKLLAGRRKSKPWESASLGYALIANRATSA